MAVLAIATMPLQLALDVVEFPFFVAFYDPLKEPVLIRANGANQLSQR